MSSQPNTSSSKQQNHHHDGNVKGPKGGPSRVPSSTSTPPASSSSPSSTSTPPNNNSNTNSGSSGKGQGKGWKDGGVSQVPKQPQPGRKQPAPRLEQPAPRLEQPKASSTLTSTPLQPPNPVPPPAAPGAQQQPPISQPQPTSPPVAVQQHYQPHPPSSHPPQQPIQPHPPPQQHPPANLNPQVPPGGPNGFSVRPPNGQPYISSNFPGLRTQSAPPNLQEQEEISPQPMFMPEKSKYYQPPPMTYYHPPNFPTMHVMPPPQFVAPMVTPPIAILKKRKGIPIIDPSTGEEVRADSPPKVQSSTAAPSSVPPVTTPSPTGLTGYNKPFVQAKAAPSTSSNTSVLATPSPSSAPQQVKNLVGGILPELSPQPQPVATISQATSESTPTENSAPSTPVVEPPRKEDIAPVLPPAPKHSPAEHTSSATQKTTDSFVETNKIVESAGEKASSPQIEISTEERSTKFEEKNSKIEEKPKEHKAPKEEKSRKEKPHKEEKTPDDEERVVPAATKKSKKLKDTIKKADEGNFSAAGFDAYLIKPKEPAKPKEDPPKEKEKDRENEKDKEPEKEIEESPPTSTSVEDSVEDDDWEKKAEDELVNEVSLRPGGSLAGIRPQSWIGEGGKKMYDRNFLLQFQSLCTERPDGLPPMEVILGYDEGKNTGQFGAAGGNKRSPVSGPPGQIAPYPANRGKGPLLNIEVRQQQGPVGFQGRPGPPFKDPRFGGRGGLNKAPPNKQISKGPLLPTPIVTGGAHNKWVPQSPGMLTENAAILKRAKGFEPLSDKLLDVGINSSEILKGIIGLVFEKALSEPKYVNMYAQLCRKISVSGKIPEFKGEGEADGKPITFKRILLNKCQEEFEVNQLNASKKELRVEGMTPDQLAEIEEKEARARKDYLDIKFIGELFKLEMLTEKIMISCITRLLGDVKSPKEEDMEALCKLMSTIGERLDQPKAHTYMSQYFERIKEISQNPILPSRIRFMLEDLIALRKNKWVPRRDTNAPKTIKEVHKEAFEKEKEKEKEFSRMRQPLLREPPRNVVGRPVERGPMVNAYAGRGNAPRGQDGWEEVPPSRRGRGPAPEAPSVRRGQEHTILAPAGGLTSSKGWAPTQQSLDKVKPDERLGRGGNAFAPLASQPAHGPQVPQGGGAPVAHSKQAAATRPPSPPPAVTAEYAESQTALMLEEYLASGDAKEVCVCIKELNAPEFHPDIVHWILSIVLEKKEREVVLADSLFKTSLAENVVTSEQLAQGFQKILEAFSDLVVDLPKAPKFMGIVIGGAISRNHLPMTFLRSLDHLIAEGIAPQLGLEIFDVIRKAKPDPQTENDLWAFFPKFFKSHTTQSHLIAYVTDKKMTHIFPSVFTRTQIESMIKDGSPVDSILKWIEHNAPDFPVDTSFARWLIRTVLKEGRPPPGWDQTKVEEGKIERYAQILTQFLSEKLDLQLQCLFEVQDYWVSTGASKTMLPGLFDALYQKDVILEDVFKTWEDDDKDTPKKKDALVCTLKFMTWLATASEESDDQDEK